MLKVERVSKTFDGFIAVHDTDLSIEKGQIVSVIGPNGAGKTTLFNLITGQLRPDEGNILFHGQKTKGLLPHKICKMGISRSFQIENIFHRMTVFENIQVSVAANRQRTYKCFSPSKKESVNETYRILTDIGLKEKSEMISGSLSHGDQKILDIGIALGNRPELIVLDEPTAGLSHEETQGIIELIDNLCRTLGLTILLCEHNIELVFSLSDKIMVMQSGMPICEGTPEKVRNDPKVQAAYLGVKS